MDGKMIIEEMKIELSDMHFYAYHGVLDQERKVGNHFTLQLTAWTQVEKSLETDLLEDTLSYADIYETIAEEMAHPSQLLEHVVGRISKRLYTEYPRLLRLSLTLTKDNPPFPGDVTSASFTLCSRRDG